MKLRVAALVAVVGLGAGCAAKSAAPGEVDVAVQLDGAQVAVLGLGPHDPGRAAPPLARGRAPLVVELRNGGSVVARRTVADPRWVHSEFDVSGAPRPHEQLGASGSFDVDLPNRGGDLYVLAVAPGGGAAGELGHVTLPRLGAGEPFRRVAGGGPAGPAPVKIVDHGACAAVNMLILPEGYTAAELGKFAGDAGRAAALLSMRVGFAEHWGVVNAWRLDVASADSGIYDPRSPGQEKHTAFGYGFDRDIKHLIAPRPRAGSVTAQASAWEARNRIHADIVLILANTKLYGGSGASTAAVSSLDPTAMGGIIPHELGHSLFQLADEYDGGGTCDGSSGVGHANVARAASSPPWRDLVNTSELPTLHGGADTVGAWEGAHYCKTGVFRPQQTCLMRELQSNGAPTSFCRVCQREANRWFSLRQGAAQKRGGASCPPAMAPSGCGSGGVSFSGRGTLTAPGDNRHGYTYFDLDMSTVAAGSQLTLTLTVDGGASAASADLFPPGATVLGTGYQTDSICTIYDQDPSTSASTSCTLPAAGHYRLGVEGNWFSPAGSTNTFSYTLTSACETP